MDTCLLANPQVFWPFGCHGIGGQVLTIEVSTYADVGDMNMHCTATFGKARQGALYTSY